MCSSDLRSAWDKLPSSYKAIFSAAAADSASVMQNRYDALNPPALEKILASDRSAEGLPMAVGLQHDEREVSLVAGRVGADEGVRQTTPSIQSVRVVVGTSARGDVRPEPPHRGSADGRRITENRANSRTARLGQEVRSTNNSICLSIGIRKPGYSQS